MARGKKAAKELLPEEKLQQALVPVEEQPYPIPENWCWTRAGNLSSLHRGVSYKKADAHATKEKDDCLIMRGGNIGEGYIVTDVDNVYVNKSLVDESQFVRQNDIIIVASTGSTKVIGRAGISTRDYEDVSFGAFLMLVRPVGQSSPKYLDFFFQSDDYRTRMRNLASGVNINNIRGHYITDMPIPFPPLPEQHRIVNRIESLFAKLDEAKEKAQAVVDGFELRKSAILHKAFTGELTERWRKEHGVGLESWKRCTVGSICNDVKVGIVIRPSQYYTDKNEGTPAFRSANVREYKIDDFDWVYLNEDGMVNNKRSIVHTGDVLVVRSGNPGTACVVSEKFDGYNAIDILIAVPNQELILSNYLCLFTNSPLGKQSVTEGKRGMALAHFNVKGYSKVQLNVPPISEQEKIIHTLNESLDKEQQAKEAASTVLSQIDTMKKAILARAFRGELGTNDPAEEWAGELLKKTL